MLARALMIADSQLDTHVADLTSAAVVGYLARVESVRLVRQYVRLTSSEADCFLQLLHYWAKAGAPEGEFDLRLPALYLDLGQSKNTVKKALARLVAVGLVAALTTTPGNTATAVILGPYGAELEYHLVEIKGQKLTLSNRDDSKIKGQFLTLSSTTKGQKLTLNPSISITKGQSLTLSSSSNAESTPLKLVTNQSVIEGAKNERRENREKFGHSNSIGIVGSKVLKDSSSNSSSKQLPAKKPRARKGDADFPAEVVESFEKFWNAYGVDGRKLDRADCLPVWASEYTEADRAAVLSMVEDYVKHNKHRPDGSGGFADYRPYPLKFLKKRRFEAWLDKMKATNQPTNQPTRKYVSHSASRRQDATRVLESPQHVGGFGLDD